MTQKVTSGPRTETMEFSVLNGTSTSYSLPHRVREQLEREGVKEKILKARCWERFLQMVSSQHDTVGVLVKS